MGHPRTTRRTPRSAALALAIALALAPAASAQLYPWFGLQPRNAQLWREEGIAGNGPQMDDHFGMALAAGDFNGDHVTDLAVGIPGNDCLGNADCGSARAILGWPGLGLYLPITLDPVNDTQFGIGALAQYGRALAAADFNKDGRDDLAVGVPGRAGVRIHYGDPTGIEVQPQQQLRESIDGVPGVSVESDNRFAQVLATGDFNGDGYADLAIGAPRDDDEPSIYSTNRVGGVYIAHGHDGGLVPFEGFLVRENLDGYLDSETPEVDDELGAALAVGDFNCDGYDDLAIGIPGEDGVGQVMVLSGSVGSLVFANVDPNLAPKIFSQWDYVLRDPEVGDRYGAALVAGDFDGDHCDDLAVGAPNEDFEYVYVTPIQDGGRVDVLFGSYPAGLRVDSSVQLLKEDYALGSGTGYSHSFEHFGAALAAADLNDDHVDDLVVGVPSETIAGPNSGGAMTILGGAGFPWNRPARLLYPGTLRYGLINALSTGQPFFGYALAVGDFDGNRTPDLALGGPYANLDSVTDTGSVAVTYGQLFVDGFEEGGSFYWAAPAP